VPVIRLDPGKYFFHYTTREAAFGGILPSRRLRLSPYGAMRDPLENQQWHFTFSGRGARDDATVIADDAEQTEFERRANQESRARSHLLSLTIDAEPQPDGERPPFCFGWARARMWEQYAERYRGVCLVFDKERLAQRFAEALEGGTVTRTYHRAVIYSGAGMLKPIIEADAARNDPDFFDGYVEANHGALFFTKILDWQTEHEYRFVAIATADDSSLSIDYGDALKWVIAGNQLADRERPAAVGASRQAGARPLLMRWERWRPGLVELEEHQDSPVVTPMQTDSPGLTRLKEAVRRAEIEMRAPPPAGEVKEMLPLTEYFADQDRNTKWRVVSEIRFREKELYNRFGNEPFLANAVIDLVAESDCEIDWRGLLEGLEQFLNESSNWIISIPLSNALTQGYTPITERVGLAEVLQDRDWERDSEAPVDNREIFDHLGDYIDVGARWHQEDTYTGPLDGRRTAALIFREEGAEPLALSVARTKARYAIAMWCLLVPPEWRHLWPTLADWEPRPYIERGTKHKKFDKGAWTRRSPVKGGHITHYEEYEVPRRSEFLRAPFDAIERANANSLPARAALSAAWSLYLAERIPADFERTDRVMLVSAAIDSLCDLGQGPTEEAGVRWARFTERHGIWREMRGAYLQGEIEEAKVLARDLRNVATHGSDDILLNLGYPPEQTRVLRGGRKRTGHELSVAEAAVAFPVLATAVHSAARRVAFQGIESGWDENVFRDNFAPLG